MYVHVRVCEIIIIKHFIMFILLKRLLILLVKFLKLCVWFFSFIFYLSVVTLKRVIISSICPHLQTALLNTKVLHWKVQLICSEPTLKPKSTLEDFDQLITFLQGLFDRTYHVMMRALHPD